MVLSVDGCPTDLQKKISSTQVLAKSSTEPAVPYRKIDLGYLTRPSAILNDVSGSVPQEHYKVIAAALHLPSEDNPNL